MIKYDHLPNKWLRESLEFSQQLVVTLTTENKVIRESVKSLIEWMARFSHENKKIKETLLRTLLSTFRLGV